MKVHSTNLAFHMWDKLTIVWNDLTILWNDLAIDWNDLTWNDLTMERNDRIPISPNGSTTAKQHRLWFVHYEMF